MSDQAILDLILAAEGDTFTDDPDDNGGATRYGVTQRQLAQWRGVPATSADVAKLTRPEAEAIYRALYIRPFDGLPSGLRENVIDMAVNSGQTRALRLCQQLIGATVDGVLGPETLRLAMTRDWTDAYSIMRIAYYERLIEKDPTQVRFRHGWRARALRFMDEHLSATGEVLSALLSERVGKAHE